jgi:hypothetical protein
VYFVITQSDGDVNIAAKTKDEVERDLNEEGADRPLTKQELEGVGPDPAYWPQNACLIIKGEVAEVTIGKLNIT